MMFGIMKNNSILFAALLSVPVLALAAKANPLVFHPAYAPSPADNPLKGFVPYVGQGREFPHALEFSYLPLASLMIGPTTFNWVPLEEMLDSVASRGCQSVFRIYLEYPRRPSGVPEYLVKAGVKVRAWTNTNTQPFPPALDHTPDYEDPRLRSALTNFIAALGARYDGDPRIGFITAGPPVRGANGTVIRMRNGSRQKQSRPKSWMHTRRRFARRRCCCATGGRQRLLVRSK